MCLRYGSGYVPHSLHKLEWFSSDRDLLVGDLVYSMKIKGALGNKCQ